VSINVESAIIPGFGMVVDSTLSGANCLLAHVSTIAIGKSIQKSSEWIFEFYPRLFCCSRNLLTSCNLIAIELKSFFRKKAFMIKEYINIKIIMNRLTALVSLVAVNSDKFSYCHIFFDIIV